MRKLRILAVGSKNVDFVEQGVAFYHKKLNRYCSFEIREIKEADYSKGTKNSWLENEQGKIEKALRSASYKIICDEKGKNISSVDFAKKIQQLGNQGISSIDFVVGGAYGLPEKIRNEGDILLSFSKMTMPHQLFRLFLVEQIYRAFTILKGEKYHH